MLGTAEGGCVARAESQVCGLISPVEGERGRARPGPALSPQPGLEAWPCGWGQEPGFRVPALV